MSVRASAQTALFGALTLANVGNFGFHALTSHLLGPALYGAVGSILALLAAVTVPLTAYQAVLCAQVRRLHDAGVPIDVSHALRRLLGAGAVAAGAVAATAPAVAGYLHLGSAVPVALAAGYLLPLAASTLGWAVTTGTGRYGRAALAALAMVATRLTAGALLLHAGTGVAGAVTASVLSETLLAAVLLWRTPARYAGVRSRLDLGWRSGSYSVGTSVGLWLLLGSDVLLARHLFPGVRAGEYVAAATIARVAMFLPQSVATVFVADFAEADPAAAVASLRRAARLSAWLGAAAAAALVVAVRPVTLVLFGPAFVVPVRLVTVLSTADALLAVLSVVVQFHLARGGRRAYAPWAGVAALLSATVVLHPSAVPLSALLLVSVLLALVLAVNGVTLSVLPVRPGLVPGGHDLDLTVVIPYYNPGGLLRPNTMRLIDALRRAEVSFEVVAVSDGSTDGSAGTLADLDPSVLRRVELPRNCGKGAAVRAGLRMGRGRYLGFIDADGDLNPELWQPVLTLLRLYRPDAIVGSKWHPLSDVRTSPVRRAYSRGYRMLHRLLFRLPVRDTQVGLKVFRRELLADVLPYAQERRFTFDLELLAVARRLGYRRMMEAPVTLVAQGSSTVRLRTVVLMLVETLRLSWRLHTLTEVPSKAADIRPWPQQAAREPGTVTAA